MQYFLTTENGLQQWCSRSKQHFFLHNSFGYFNAKIQVSWKFYFGMRPQMPSYCCLMARLWPVTGYVFVLFYFIISFFSFLATLWCMELPNQGSDPSSYSSTESLTHSMGLRNELVSQCSRDLLIPFHHSGNSAFIFFFFSLLIDEGPTFSIFQVQGGCNLYSEPCLLGKTSLEDFPSWLRS